MQCVAGVCHGHALVDGEGFRGWMMGAFHPPESPLHDPHQEVKFDSVRKGVCRPRNEASADSKNRTLQILVEGHIRTTFPATAERGEYVAELSAPGHYALWESGVLHFWEALTDSVVITIRWPAQPTQAT